MGSRLARRAAAFTVLVLAIAGVAQGAARPLKLKSEHVSSLHESVLAASNGRTLYRLRPETSRHLLCKSKACLSFWPPLLVRSKSTHVRLPKGVKGKVGFIKRGKKFQVTLSGKPLYMYGGDSRARQANGQHIKTFGGEWFVLRAKSSSSSPSPSPQPPAPSPPPYPY